jgi:hypothetical protein
METIVTIVDISRSAAYTVSFSGMTPEGNCIRPILSTQGMKESWLFEGEGAAIRPFARIIVDLLGPDGDATFLENQAISPSLKEVGPSLAIQERRNFLNRILDPSVADIFGTNILENKGFFVQPNGHQKSMGMIRVANFIWAAYNNHYGSWNYRICFHDTYQHYYSLRVTDL